MESAMECLRKVKQKFLDEQTKKETQHAKCLNFESKVQLFKEQKQSAIQVNVTCEKALLEKIQGLEEHVQLANAKDKEAAAQREIENKHATKSTKWKALRWSSWLKR